MCELVRCSLGCQPPRKYGQRPLFTVAAVLLKSALTKDCGQNFGNVVVPLNGRLRLPDSRVLFDTPWLASLTHVQRKGSLESRSAWLVHNPRPIVGLPGRLPRSVV